MRILFRHVLDASVIKLETIGSRDEIEETEEETQLSDLESRLQINSLTRGYQLCSQLFVYLYTSVLRCVVLIVFYGLGKDSPVHSFSISLHPNTLITYLILLLKPTKMSDIFRLSRAWSRVSFSIDMLSAEGARDRKHA